MNTSKRFWPRLFSRATLALLIGGFASQSWAALWVTGASPNSGNYTISWGQPLGCVWYSFYIQVCTWVEEKTGTGAWVQVAASGTSMSFSGKPVNSYEYRLMAAYTGSGPQQSDWLPIVVTPTPVVTVTFRKCISSPNNTCDSPSALQMDMINSGEVSSLPYGSVILSSADSVPVSAYLTVCSGSGGKSACPIIDNAGVVELDNKMFARAAKIDPILIPAGVASSAVQGGPQWELVSGSINQTLHFTGASSYSFWHGLWSLSLNIVYMDFVDARDGSVHRIWLNDTVTLKFSDGSTAQFKLIGPNAPSGLFFQLVPGSERDANGDPVAAITAPNASPGPGYVFTFTPVFVGPDSITASLFYNIFYRCITTVTYYDPDGLLTYYRKHTLCGP
jgi:hypothetical protein